MAVQAFAPAIGPLVSAIMSMGAQDKQQNLAEAELNFRRSEAARQRRMAMDGSSDAYGNRTRYVPGRGWVVDNTPLTQAILDAEQKENQQRLTVDARRQRQASERKDSRSRRADDAFKDEFDSYQYAYRPSEESYTADHQVAAALADKNRNEGGLGALAAAIMRTGDSNQLEKLNDVSGSDSSAAARLAEALLGAKAQGTQRYLAETGGRDAVMGGRLSTLGSIANNVDGVSTSNTNLNPMLTSMMEKDSDNLLSTMARGAGSVAEGMRGVTAAAGRSVDLGPLVNSIVGGMTQKQPTAQEKALAELLMQQQFSDAQLGLLKNKAATSEIYSKHRGAFS